MKGYLTFDFNELALNSIVTRVHRELRRDRSRGLPFRRRLLPSSSCHLRRSLDVTELILSRDVRLTSTANFHANSSGRAFRSKISRVAPVAQSDPLPPPPLPSPLALFFRASSSSSCFNHHFLCRSHLPSETSRTLRSFESASLLGINRATSY